MSNVHVFTKVGEVPATVQAIVKVCETGSVPGALNDIGVLTDPTGVALQSAGAVAAVVSV